VSAAELQHPIMRVCSTDPTRLNLMKPWLCKWRGEAWTAAANGRAGIMVRGALPIETETSEKVPDLGSLIPAAFAGVAVDRAALRTWAGEIPPEPPCPCGGTKVRECSDCEGKKRVRHECNCEECTTDWDTCDWCRGKGTEACDCIPRAPPAVPGIMLGASVDRLLIAALLDAAPAGPCHVQVAAEFLVPIALHGDGWVALVMQTRLTDDELKAAPRFEVAAP
jgi:hypothetical protein